MHARLDGRPGMTGRWWWWCCCCCWRCAGRGRLQEAATEMQIMVSGRLPKQTGWLAGWLAGWREVLQHHCTRHFTCGVEAGHRGPDPAARCADVGVLGTVVAADGPVGGNLSPAVVLECAVVRCSVSHRVGTPSTVTLRSAAGAPIRSAATALVRKTAPGSVTCRCIAACALSRWQLSVQGARPQGPCFNTALP
jgi:hypothetical protein